MGGGSCAGRATVVWAEVSERKGSRARADMGGGADHGAPGGRPGTNRADSAPHLRAVGRALRFGTKILPIGHQVCAVGRGLSRHDSQSSLGTKVRPGRQ